MARLFISCNNRNFNVGRRLERALERRKHVMTLRVNARPAGRWEEQLLRGGLHGGRVHLSAHTRRDGLFLGSWPDRYGHLV